MKLKYLIPFIILVVGVFLLKILSSPKQTSVIKDESYKAYFKLPVLDQDKQIASEDITQPLYIVNFFASWCGSCKQEHAVLIKLAKSYKIYGIAVHDEIKALKNFEKSENPYTEILIDENSKTMIDWGVKSLPETFVIKNNKILSHTRGPIDDKILSEILALKF